MKKLKSEWKKWEKSAINQFINCFYQKELFEDIFANINEYYFNDKHTWELSIQIPDEKSPVKETINITVFTYYDLDFIKIEKDAIKIIKLLLLDNKKN